MRVAVPKEIKADEYRVGLTPEGAKQLTARGHQVLIEKNAGSAIGFSDEHYEMAGATLCKSPIEVYEQGQLIVKVKEPQPKERALLKPEHTLFTYLHLAADTRQTQDLLSSGATCIAYETVSNANGQLPLLAPMSEIAGRMATQAAAQCLEITQGGQGILLSGATGVPPANVVVIGGGVAGTNAARIATGMGAKVTVLDTSHDRLNILRQEFNDAVTCELSTPTRIMKNIQQANVVIGAALIPGALSPTIITKDMLGQMQRGSVLVDIAIDQGGCFATSKPTTHAKPTYEVDGIIHYCVANIPGAVAQTATLALTNASLPYVLKLADLGTINALKDSTALQSGLNIHNHELYCQNVASSQNIACKTIDEILRTD